MPLGRSGPLPSFTNPPLTEVALAVQWEPLSNLGLPHFGMFWEQIREQFPSFAHQAPLSPMSEQAGLPTGGQGPDFRVGTTPDIPRMWFLNESGSELLQLQSDRLVRNWRKVGPEHMYPRYEEHIRPAFRRDLDRWLAFIEREQLGTFVPNQCEVVYVNQIDDEDLLPSLADIGNVLSDGFALPRLEFAPDLTPESERFELSYLLNDERGQFRGRLRVSCIPGYPQGEDMPSYQFRLQVRGHPGGSGVEDVLSFFDTGRDRIVRAFTALTSSTSHAKWGRENGS